MNEAKREQFLVGDPLARAIANLTGNDSGKFSRRDFVAPLIGYCENGKHDGNIGIVYGLRSTGKTVGMLQAAQTLIERGHKVAYAQFNYEESGMRDANDEILRLADKGYTHFFIDEAPYLGGFIHASAEWADTFVPARNLKIIISGTDSFIIWLAMGGALFHRFVRFSTNMNTYPEYKRVWGKGFEDFKAKGGVFITAKADDDAESGQSETVRESANAAVEQYIQAAVVDNIVHTIEHIEDNPGRHNYYTGALLGIDETVIFKAVISILKCTVEQHIKNRFTRYASTKNIADLGSAVNNWAADEKRELKKRVVESLDLYANFVKIDNPEHTIEVLINFLVKIGCLVESFAAQSDLGDDHQKPRTYYFSHNALMHYAAQETIRGLLRLDAIDHKAFADGVNSASEGYYNENIVWTHILYFKKPDEHVFKYHDNKDREIDAVILNREKKTLCLIEVKSKKNVNDQTVFIDEARWLYDDEILKNTRVDEAYYIRRVIVYKGDSRAVSHSGGALILANIEEFICHQHDLDVYFDRIISP
jgi:predicted AAA+ superfamily ATPase